MNIAIKMLVTQYLVKTTYATYVTRFKLILLSLECELR
jgi:hypothetical protein